MRWSPGKGLSPDRPPALAKASWDGGRSSAALEGRAGAHHPRCSPGQGCRLHSRRCSVSRAWHGTPAGPSAQLRCRSIVPPPQGAEQLLQADQGPRTGHSWCGHIRDPLVQVLWTGVKGTSQGERSLCFPVMPITLTCPKPPTQSSRAPRLATSGQPYQFLQSSCATSAGATTHEALGLGRPQQQEEMGTQCPSCISWPGGQRQPGGWG